MQTRWSYSFRYFMFIAILSWARCVLTARHRVTEKFALQRACLHFLFRSGFSLTFYLFFSLLCYLLRLCGHRTCSVRQIRSRDEYTQNFWLKLSSKYEIGLPFAIIYCARRRASRIHWTKLYCTQTHNSNYRFTSFRLQMRWTKWKINHFQLIFVLVLQTEIELVKCCQISFVNCWLFLFGNHLPCKMH